MPRLFIDMDGVLTDFDGQFLKWFGAEVQVSRYKSDPATRRTMDRHLAGADREFWASMPWLAGAEDFWDRIRSRSPVILSSPHFAAGCVPGKTLWIQRHLEPQVAFILDTDKGTHSRPGDLLIDDSPENAAGWKGRFILHQTWEQTWRALDRDQGKNRPKPMEEDPTLRPSR